MRVFVSWSGEDSHRVAKALKDWIPKVIQAVEVFLSSEDIEKGSQWFQELGGVLEESSFAILCLTRQNLAAPWILFEAGAVAKGLSGTRVTPLLVGLKTEDLDGPLAQLNATLAERDDFRRLLIDINKQLGDRRLSQGILEDAFQGRWPELEKALAQTASPAADFKYDVFLSSPMAGFANDAEYQAGRAEIEKVFSALKEQCGFRVFWASEKIKVMADFETVDVSVMGDLEALRASRYFLLVYPRKMPTSALFEAGYALALGKPSRYFVRERADLPFLMRELPGAVKDVFINTKDDWSTYDDLAREIVRNKDRWFAR